MPFHGTRYVIRKIDGEVGLLGTKFKRTLSLHGSIVTGKLNADGMEVGGGLYLRDSGTFADIDLLGAKIGGNIQLAGSTFGGELDLTGSVIDGELHFSSGWQESPPTWQNSASLILRNAKVEALQAREGSWNISGGDGFLPTDLTGFTFDRLGGLDTSGGTGMGDESADWLIGWIEAQRDHGENYDPQPYTQLARVPEAAGAADKAKAVRFAKFKHKHDHDISMSSIRRAVLTVERYFLWASILAVVARIEVRDRRGVLERAQTPERRCRTRGGCPDRGARARSRGRVLAPQALIAVGLVDGPPCSRIDIRKYFRTARGLGRAGIGGKKAPERAGRINEVVRSQSVMYRSRSEGRNRRGRR